MIYSYAPMEGITTWWYRQVVNRHFSNIDRYYTFFLTPRYGAVMGRDVREIRIENNRGLSVIPQIMTNKSDLFASFVREIKEKGYEEVNLNLGCPMQTVVKKQRASWFLSHLEELREFLDGIFSSAELPISIKTRVGFDSLDLLPRLIELFNCYPIKELIVHPRLRTDFYKGSVRMEAFDEVYRNIKVPLSYNGDMFSPEDVKALREKYPDVKRIMLGRGLITNPSLARLCEGNAQLTMDEFISFHMDMQSTMMSVIEGGDIYLDRMKEFWWYWCRLFEDGERLVKDVRKARKTPDYNRAVEKLFNNAVMKERPYFL